jgi:hypothetical protein
MSMQLRQFAIDYQLRLVVSLIALAVTLILSLFDLQQGGGGATKLQTVQVTDPRTATAEPASHPH